MQSPAPPHTLRLNLNGFKTRLHHKEATFSSSGHLVLHVKVRKCKCMTVTGEVRGLRMEMHVCIATLLGERKAN